MGGEKEGKKKEVTTLPFAISREPTVEMRRGKRQSLYTRRELRVSTRNCGFRRVPKGRVFSYTGSFSLKGRKWSYGTAPTMGLSFQTLRLFLDNSGLACEGRYLGQLWVPERLENKFRVGFGSETVGKCMLNFVLFSKS